MLLAAATLASNAPAALPAIQGGRLFHTAGQSLQIRAVAYSPAPIGLTRPANDAQIHTVPIMQRDGPLLAEMGANTLRIYGGLRCDTSGNAVTTLTADFVRAAARRGYGSSWARISTRTRTSATRPSAARSSPRM